MHSGSGTFPDPVLCFDDLPRAATLSKEASMASPGMAPVTAPNTTASNNFAQKTILEHALKSRASWFIMVAGLSLVNSVLSMTGAKVHFIFGLGFTQIVDAVAHRAGGAGMALDLVINGIVAGVFAFFWNFARKGQKWAWFAGMGLYAVDALVLLPFKDFLSLAFHAYALYRMWSGLQLLPAFERFNRSAAAGTVSSTL